MIDTFPELCPQTLRHIEYVYMNKLVHIDLCHHSQ